MTAVKQKKIGTNFIVDLTAGSTRRKVGNQVIFNCFHKALAEKISIKTGEKYSDVTRLIRLKMSFLVLRAGLKCLRGWRTLYRNSEGETCGDFALTLNEIGGNY